MDAIIDHHEYETTPKPNSGPKFRSIGSMPYQKSKEGPIRTISNWPDQRGTWNMPESLNTSQLTIDGVELGPLGPKPESSSETNPVPNPGINPRNNLGNNTDLI